MPARADAAPSSPPARKPSPAPAPPRAPAPAPAPARTPAPAPAPAPAPDSIEDQLRILGARPVTETRPKKEKPKTAKEALRARTGGGAKGPATKKAAARAEVARTVLGSNDAEAAAESAADHDEDVSAPVSDAEPESEASPPKKAGLWAKIKGFFGGG
jgi:hypothetical protein